MTYLETQTFWPHTLGKRYLRKTLWQMLPELFHRTCLSEGSAEMLLRLTRCRRRSAQTHTGLMAV